MCSNLGFISRNFSGPGTLDTDDSNLPIAEKFAYSHLRIFDTPNRLDLFNRLGRGCEVYITRKLAS